MVSRLNDGYDDPAPARIWHWIRCACGGALALAAGTAVFFLIGGALLSVLPDRYDNTALVVAGMTGAALVLAAFVLPQRLSALALCAGCAMLLAVGALLA
jgi:hypothetical protein